MAVWVHYLSVWSDIAVCTLDICFYQTATPTRSNNPYSVGLSKLIPGYFILFIHLKVSPSKTVVCFILNNLHFPMVEAIAFYAYLYIGQCFYDMSIFQMS